MWAVTRPNLFEYLAKPVEDRPFGDSTEITEADDDEYDAPHFTAGASSLGPDFIWAETMNTRADEDTYDDDVGIGALGIPFSSLETTKTSMTYDTYDNDVDVFVAGTPMQRTTRHTSPRLRTRRMTMILLRRASRSRRRDGSCGRQSFGRTRPSGAPRRRSPRCGGAPSPRRPHVAGRRVHTHERGLTLNGVHVDAAGAHRGWLRRYAPSGWGMGIVAGSLDAATHRSFLTLVGSIARKSSCDWLTPIDNMLRAEDRLVQLDVAARLGILAPRTVVTSSAETAIGEAGQRFVVKPLSLGYFVTEDGPQAVFTSEMDATTARQLDFGGAPFVAQQMVETERHFRVVTVGDRGVAGQPGGRRSTPRLAPAGEGTPGMAAR